MVMNDAPAVSLASEDPGGSDLKQRLHRIAWNLEAPFLKLYGVPEVPVYVRRNPLDRPAPRFGICGQSRTRKGSGSSSGSRRLLMATTLFPVEVR
jgi:hypothetical protein